MGAHRKDGNGAGSAAQPRSFQRRRVIVQIASLLALHSSWGPEAKWFCNPVLSCHSCALAWFACPIGLFIHFAGWHVWPFMVLGTVLLLGTMFGRLLCGWICPFGTLQDFLYKIRSPKMRLPKWTTYVKYAVLLVFVVAIPYWWGETHALVFCRGCPAAAIQVTMPALATEGLPHVWGPTVVRLLILAAVLALAVVSSRSFCRIFCPIGALLAPMNYVALWVIGNRAGGCVLCRKCDRVCTMDGNPSALAEHGVPVSRQPECIYCYRCDETCPMPANPKRETQCAVKEANP